MLYILFVRYEIYQTGHCTSTVYNIELIIRIYKNSFSTWYRYDTRKDFHDRNIDTTGDAVLRMRSSVCIGYANLFAELCRYEHKKSLSVALTSICLDVSEIYMYFFVVLENVKFP